jgi:transcriptional regulator with XRE-family HTH domain
LNTYIDVDWDRISRNDYQGRKLRMLREAKNLTQENLAELVKKHTNWAVCREKINRWNSISMGILEDTRYILMELE